MTKLNKIFQDQYVNVILNNVSVVQYNSETGDQIQGNVMIGGIFIDSDESFIYLGTSEKEITDAIKISDIARITTINEEDTSMFDAVDSPTNEDEWN